MSTGIAFTVKAYSPFGAVLEGRKNSSQNKYRRGFNGQERDDEIAGFGNINTAEFWEYDTRLGRRWNLDIEKYSFGSDYMTMLNSPISNYDPDGAVVRYGSVRAFFAVLFARISSPTVRANHRAWRNSTMVYTYRIARQNFIGNRLSNAVPRQVSGPPGDTRLHFDILIAHGAGFNISIGGKTETVTKRIVYREQSKRLKIRRVVPNTTITVNGEIHPTSVLIRDQKTDQTILDQKLGDPDAYRGVRNQQQSATVPGGGLKGRVLKINLSNDPKEENSRVTNPHIEQNKPVDAAHITYTKYKGIRIQFSITYPRYIN